MDTMRTLRLALLLTAIATATTLTACSTNETGVVVPAETPVATSETPTTTEQVPAEQRSLADSEVSEFASEEQEYLTKLQSQNMDEGFSSEDDLVHIGHGICDAINAGNTVQDVIDGMEDGTWMTTTQAQVIPVVAVFELCPENAN